MLEGLRLKLLDVLDSQRGNWVALIAFLVSWAGLITWISLWNIVLGLILGLLLGWIPAAIIAIYVGYVFR